MPSLIRLRWKAVLAVSLVIAVLAALWVYREDLIAQGQEQIRTQWLEQMQSDTERERAIERKHYEQIQDFEAERAESLRAIERERSRVWRGADRGPDGNGDAGTAGGMATGLQQDNGGADTDDAG